MNITTNNPNIYLKNNFSPRVQQNHSDRAPFYPETIDILDNVYADYRKSLNETSFNEIKTTALDVSEEMQIPKKEVLKAMQLLTQFSNMNDLKIVSKEINKENIENFGNENSELCFNCIDKGFSSRNIANISAETGIHRSLRYLLDEKKLAPFNVSCDGKIGIILDDEKIGMLEQVKKSQPENFNEFVNDKNLKFFYISGWDSGISIVNRTKNLKKETKALLKTAKKQKLPLEKAIDYPYMDRINELGIKPIVIKNENEANELTVYNQMRPEQIRTKNQLFNIVEANTLNRFSGGSDTQKAISNHISAKYLEDTLSVYTFEKMSKDLKKLNAKINKFASEKNKEPIYVIPRRNIKSSDFINYSFKKINNIEASKFVYMDQLSNYFKNDKDRSDKTLVVIIDDCALSGNSMRDIFNSNVDLCRLNSNIPILFANLKCSDEALSRFKPNSDTPVDVMYVDKVKSHYIDNDRLEDIIGQPQYRETAYSLSFPYMAPDNNSELATNIALLHNSKYNSSNFASDFQRKIYRITDIENLSEADKKFVQKQRDERMAYAFCTKNITDDVLETSATYARTIGSLPVTIVEDSICKTTPEELKIITEEIYRDKKINFSHQ